MYMNRVKYLNYRQDIYDDLIVTKTNIVIKYTFIQGWHGPRLKKKCRRRIPSFPITNKFSRETFAIKKIVTQVGNC